MTLLPQCEITLEDSNGRLLINRRYPQIVLTTNNPAVPVNSTFIVQADINSKSLNEIDPERITLLLVDDPENYKEAEISIPFKLLNGAYKADVPGLSDSGTYELTTITLVDGKKIETINSDSISVKAVQLPRITNLAAYEVQDGTFIIEYDIINDEIIRDIIPELEVLWNGESLFKEKIENHEVVGENKVDNHPLQEEGEYEIILHIEGLSPDNLNYADTYRISHLIAYPTVQPNPLPSPTSLPQPTPTQSQRPSPTAQASQNFPPKKVREIWPYLSIIFIILLVVLAFVVFKNRLLIKQNKDQVGGNQKPTGISEPKIDKTNAYQQQTNSETPYGKTQIEQKNLEESVIDTLENIKNDGKKATRDIRGNLSQLETFYVEGNTNTENGYYDEYVRTTLDSLTGLQVKVFLRALVVGIVKHWKEDQGSNYIVSIVYDKILSLTSNPDITFGEVVKAFVNETGGQPIINDFFQNWGEIHSDSNKHHYAKFLDQESVKADQVDSLKHVYSFFQNIDNSDYSYGNKEKYEQVQKNLTPSENQYRSQNLYLLLKEVKPAFITTPPTDYDEWCEYKAILEKVDLELNKPNKTYAKLPEAVILTGFLQKWLIKANAKIGAWAEEPPPINPGRLELEIRPSIKPSETPDESESNQEWKYLVRGIIYQTSGADVENLQLLYTMNKQQPISINLGTHDRNTKLTRNNYIKFAFAPEPVEPAEIVFDLDFQTLITVGNTHESRRYNEQAPYKLNIASDLPSYLLEKEIKSPFILGRPLTKHEVEQFVWKRPQQIVAELTNYLNQLEYPAFIVLEGSRQSGKTTIMNMVLDGDADFQNYIVIKIDLMEWWKEYIEGKNIVRVQDYRHQFWQCCYRTCIDGLSGVHEKSVQNILDKQQNGTTPFSSLKNLMSTLRTETGVRPLLVVDDADIFENFEDEISRLTNELISFCDSTDGVIWTANDNRSVTWLDRLHELFRAHKNAEQKTLRTGLAEEYDVTRILQINGLLTLTPLARRAAYIFTGGWISLVQLLGGELINNINRKVNADHERAYSLVTVGDIRGVVVEFSRFRPKILDYLNHSFTSCEILLMQVLVKERVIDADTGILQGVRFKSGGLDGKFLQEKFEQAHADKKIEPLAYDYLKNYWKSLFYQLKEKGVLENIVFPGQLSQLVRLRIGWLYHYFDSHPYDVCEPKYEVEGGDDE